MPTLTAERPATAAHSDKVSRYFARIDDHVADMTPGEKTAFYLRERARWLSLEQNFFSRVDSGAFALPGETAVDYTITIAELGARITRGGR